jgi:hypothetical protein
MQEAGGDRGGVHLQIGEDLGDFERMDDVGLARGSALAFMLFLTEGPCSADQIEIVMRAVGANGGEYALETAVEAVFERRGSEGRSGGRDYFEPGLWAIVAPGRWGKGAGGLVQRV